MGIRTTASFILFLISLLIELLSVGFLVLYLPAIQMVVFPRICLFYHLAGNRLFSTKSNPLFPFYRDKLEFPSGCYSFYCSYLIFLGI